MPWKETDATRIVADDKADGHAGNLPNRLQAKEYWWCGYPYGGGFCCLPMPNKPSPARLAGFCVYLAKSLCTNWPMGKCRILSLDGGGSWALIQVKALIGIYGEEIRGLELLSKFRLVAGNSGGSIVLALLLKDCRLDEILDFFKSEEKRRAVFVNLPWYKKLSRCLLPALFELGPLYSAPAKLQGLQQLLGEEGNMSLAQLKQAILASGKAKHTEYHFPDLLITSFDYDRKRAVYFRSNESSLAGSFSTPRVATLAQAVHASSNAPVNYFNRPAQFSTCRYWDGGVGGNNNPVLAGLTEALANQACRDDIQILSIGTGQVLLPMNGPAEDDELLVQPNTPFLINDIREMAMTILDDPPDAATFIAYVMLGQPLPASRAEARDSDKPIQTAVVRMNPLVQPVRDQHRLWRLPGWNHPKGLTMTEFKTLKNLNLDAVEEEEVRCIERLCDLWLAGVVPNQPIRADADLECEIGHRNYALARAQWLAVAG